MQKPMKPETTKRILEAGCEFFRACGFKCFQEDTMFVGQKLEEMWRTKPEPSLQQVEAMIAFLKQPPYELRNFLYRGCPIGALGVSRRTHRPDQVDLVCREHVPFFNV
jgi:hypothetical protein